MEPYDLIIIGAGVIGAAIARELSAYTLRTAVLEAEADVGFGISCRNSGVVHSGIHYQPGSGRAYHAVRGNRMLEGLCDELGVPFRRLGKLTVSFTEEQTHTLDELFRQGTENGVPGLEIIGRDRMQELQPGVGGIRALHSPSTGIVSPYELTIALAEHAHANGVEFHFDEQVASITKGQELFTVTTTNGSTFQGKIIIDAAGLNSDGIAAMAGIGGHTIYPCRGEYYVLDKRLGDELNLLVYPVPGHHSGGLGIHLTNTVDGNILIGPSSEYIEDPKDLSTTVDVLAQLREEGHALLPSLTEGDFIRSFAGLRPKLTPPEVGGYRDFIIEDHDRFILLSGIESPGLTASPSIAEQVRDMVGDHLPLTGKEQLTSPIRPPARFLDLSEAAQEQLLREDPAYGSIACRCEGITKAEVLDAADRILGPVTYTGIKLRCRAMMGRCQGGFCIPRIAEILQTERGIEITDQFYKGGSSPMYASPMRRDSHEA